MKIALDCPGCGKRYEVDASLAGKKSRCKECGNTFRIPDEPAASSAAESMSRPASSTGSRDAEAVVVPSVERTRDAIGGWVRCRIAADHCIRRSARHDRLQLPALLQAIRGRCGTIGQEVAMQGLQGSVHDPGRQCTAPEPGPVEPVSSAKKSSVVRQELRGHS